MYMLVMSNSVLSIAMLMVNYSRWGSYFATIDSGLPLKLAELLINNSKPSPGHWRRSCLTMM